MGKYNLNDEMMYDFDVFPKVFAAGKESTVHIRPLGGRTVFVPGARYRLDICGLNNGDPKYYPCSSDFVSQFVTAGDEGGFAFTHTFYEEQEYFLRFSEPETDRFLYEFPVYCVEGELAHLYPFVGDTHRHTTYSDGRQNPAVVCSNCRAHGYDFMAITDHRKYAPSLEAMAFAESIPTELVVCPGEEVQLTPANGKRNDIHIINFGGQYSINALFPGEQREAYGTDPAYRSVGGECPDIYTQEGYDSLMTELCADIDVPDDVDRFTVAGCKWIFEQIRKADGLGIFAHPNWIANVFHVPESVTNYLVENRLFDAFEVLGGERYFEQNGFQTLRWYDDRARGYRYPIVGATDSHSSNPTNDKDLICSTVVFAPVCERKALIEAIKDFRSVAVDTISKEYRLVGEPRLARYTSFLMQYYFPLHDELCREEGRLMKVCATGTEEEKTEAGELLGHLYGRVARQREKYFAF